ncbi:hypothetical protein D3C75_1109120 [compost metagenome]
MIWVLLLVLYSLIGFLTYMLLRTVIQDFFGFTREQDHAYGLLSGLIWPVSVPLAFAFAVCYATYALYQHLVHTYRVISEHVKEMVSGN